MKVIGFTGNYDSGDNQNPMAYLMADSSLLFTDRPFFLPDFADAFIATPTIIVRMGRLGKCVAPKFAHRYWDAFTAGFTLRAKAGNDSRLAVLDHAFDGAAIVGDWISVTDVDSPLDAVVEAMVGDQVVSSCCLAQMHLPLDEMIAAVSTRCSIKMGDLLLTGDAGQDHKLVPGDKLLASIGGQRVLDVKVRL